MSKKIYIKEAVGVIKEWGVDCDNFDAHNYRQYMLGIECTNYFLECLKIVVDLGFKYHKRNSTIGCPYWCTTGGIGGCLKENPPTR